ncbi:MAG: phosphoribosyltransferase family protein [Cyanobacteria bacterium P01_E01_bin.35]
MTDLYVTWSEYHHKIETLAVKIYNSHWQFNQIVCLAKGGLRIGDILCRLYDKPLAILATASYGGANNQERGEIKFAEHLTTLQPLGDRILLVDDLVDSGISLAASATWLKTKYEPQITEIRTAVIWYKSSSIETPDYFVDYLPHNPWIHQPFENYEQTPIAQFATQFNQE